MLALERQNKILELLNKDGVVTVNRLSVELGVTDETVRRDLEKLEAKELLCRTHGGALPIGEGSYEPSLEKRKAINVEVKQALARKAVQYVASGDSIFLDASTTTFYMAKELKTMKNITVITNSIRVVNELCGVEGIKVISLGGIVSNNQSFVGALTIKNIEENYYAYKMFFSSKGVSSANAILEGNEQEGNVKQRMIDNSKERYYLCDKSKIGRVGHMKLTSFEKIDHFITDAELDKNLKAVMVENNVNVIHI